MKGYNKGHIAKKDAELYNKLPKCLRCKRVLKSEISIEKGYGQLCWKKHKDERLKGYFKK